ncbi:cytochrome P450 [Streptomyces sp. NPDC101225]|uniref:cytochrome P450 n=1 Tax=Streptomyces sp. NPDC101225 TaxID=3366135 RepID=UPI003808E270
MPVTASRAVTGGVAPPTTGRAAPAPHRRPGSPRQRCHPGETLRFTAPVSHIPMRYAVDIPLPTATIRKGDAILASYGAADRDPRIHGESTGTFDITRPDKQHVAFGHGVHFCLGAALARVADPSARRKPSPDATTPARRRPGR